MIKRVTQYFDAEVVKVKTFLLKLALATKGQLILKLNYPECVSFGLTILFQDLLTFTQTSDWSINFLKTQYSKAALEKVLF